MILFVDGQICIFVFFAQWLGDESAISSRAEAEAMLICLDSDEISYLDMVVAGDPTLRINESDEQFDHVVLLIYFMGI